MAQVLRHKISALTPGQDGIANGIEDVPLIISGQDLLTNDTYSGNPGVAHPSNHRQLPPRHRLWVAE